MDKKLEAKIIAKELIETAKEQERLNQQIESGSYDISIVKTLAHSMLNLEKSILTLPDETKKLVMEEVSLIAEQSAANIGETSGSDSANAELTRTACEKILSISKEFDTIVVQEDAQKIDLPPLPKLHLEKLNLNPVDDFEGVADEMAKMYNMNPSKDGFNPAEQQISVKEYLSKSETLYNPKDTAMGDEE